MEEELGTIRDHLDKVVQTVQGVTEPGGRLVLAAQVIDQLRETAKALGEYGVREQAASELLAVYESAKQAAASIQERYGVAVTPSTINRLAKR